MKTTLQIYCEYKGWQGGTIHQAMRDFSTLTLPEMDSVCGRLVDQIKNVSDPVNVLWFTKKRLGARNHES